MLYTITEMYGNEVTLDKQPPSTAIWDGFYIDSVPETLVNTIIVIDPYQYGMCVGGQIQIHDSSKALRYNHWKPRWSLVDFKSLEPMVRVLEYGAKKYTTPWASGEENWKKPMPKKAILDSAMRHLIAMMNGEEIDQESGLPHAWHLMCNAMFYSYHSK